MCILYTLWQTNKLNSNLTLKLIIFIRYGRPLCIRIAGQNGLITKANYSTFCQPLPENTIMVKIRAFFIRTRLEILIITMLELYRISVVYVAWKSERASLKCEVLHTNIDLSSHLLPRDLFLLG